MKFKSAILVLTAVSLITLSNGCNKPETAPPAPSSETERPLSRPVTDALSAPQTPAAADVQKAAADVAAQKPAEADQAAQAEKQALADKQALDRAAAEKQSQLAAAGTKVQATIDRATKLSGENKWDEVLKVLSELTGHDLTAGQQMVVDGLKATAQKQVEAAATQKASKAVGDAVGGLLTPKK